jgi:hypothetical protein
VTADAPEIKACCAAAYGSDAVRWLLGDRLHPGGAALTDRLIDALGVGPGSLVADVACGPGASALQAAARTGCRALGIDLSPANVAHARAAAEAAGLGDRVHFVVGDAERLPLDDTGVDAVLCECALCTFPDKQAAAGELARVLRPGGALALSDMTADRDRMPGELRTLDAWIACVGDARSLEELAALIDAAGLAVVSCERHDDAVGALLDRADARLRLARALHRGGAATPSAGSIERGLRVVHAARRATDDGALGYGVVLARRP